MGCQGTENLRSEQRIAQSRACRFAAQSLIAVGSPIAQLQTRAAGITSAGLKAHALAIVEMPCAHLSTRTPSLSGPISRDTAILSLRYPMHITRYFLREASTPPKWCDTPPLVLNFTQTHLCDTPFCNVWRDHSAIPHKNKHESVLRYYRYNYRAI